MVKCTCGVCKICLNREYAKKHRANAIAHGLCVVCFKNSAREGLKTCQECSDKSTSNSKKSRNKRKDKDSNIEWFTTSVKVVNKPAIKLDEKYGRFMFNKELCDKILDVYKLPQKVKIGVDTSKSIIQIKLDESGNMRLTMATKKIMGIHCKPVITWLKEKDNIIECDTYYNAVFDEKNMITIYYK